MLLLLACCRAQKGFWRRGNTVVKGILRTKKKSKMPLNSAVKHQHPRQDCQSTHRAAEKNPNLLEGKKVEKDMLLSVPDTFLAER